MNHIDGAARERAVRKLYIENGQVVIFSDCHWRPWQRLSTANCALIRVLDELRPAAIIGNGDLHDFPAASRHDPIGWETRPQIRDEIECVRDRLAEIDSVSPAAEKFWTFGNHDMNFEKRLSKDAPDFAGVHGFRLKDHYPEHWTPCWSVHVNPHLGQDGVIVQHRGDKGGMYGPLNNAKAYGRSFVQGHLHRANIFMETNANGTFYGVDGGMLADPLGDQFINYTEARVTGWRSSFTVLTFEGGRLLRPEHVSVVDELARLTQFRGEIRQEQNYAR